MAEKIIKAFITSMLVLMWLAAAVSLTSCNTSRSGHFVANRFVSKDPETPVSGPTRLSIDLFTDIVKIRNCEYIRSSVQGGYTYIHAGDCTNPIHNTNNPTTNGTKIQATQKW